MGKIAEHLQNFDSICAGIGMVSFLIIDTIIQVILILNEKRSSKNGDDNNKL